MSFVFSLMRQFTIRFRMLSAIAVVLLLLGMLGGAGMFGMFRIHDIGQRLTEQRLVEVERVGALQRDMQRARRHAKDMIIQYEKPELVKPLREKWQADTQKTEADLAALGQAGGAADGLRHFKAYRELFAQVASQIEAGAYETATIANRMSGRAEAEFEAAEKVLQQLEQELRAAMAQDVQAQGTTLNQMLLLFAVLVVITVIVVAPLTLLNMQAICQPLEVARGLAQAIASGDLSQRLQVNGRDEVADLQRALEAMRANLAGMVAQVRNASESIATASHEIASGNQDLSSRTEQTAGNVQQTGHAIETLSNTVQQTASSAQTANQLAATASQAAQQGGTVVTQAVQSMQSIAQASQKINDIIGLIDSIAFQTNILALNAAVEAARAGEAGRGFAVVASEVRSLAGRSAEAAREIKGLVDNSVTAVDGGVRLVEQAGTAMEEIVAGVKRVSDIIGEISSAASDQSQGIGQVSQSVGEIDRMTQQNAALVEQSAAAAESMREQADRLAEVVRQFRLEAGNAPALVAPRQVPALPA